MALFAVLVAAVFLLTGCAKGAEEGSYRLPLEVVPLHYELALVPYLDNAGNRSFTFDGNVQITVRAKKPAKEITLHSDKINIEDINISGLTIEKYEVETERNFLTIFVSETLEIDSIYNITIRYTGEVMYYNYGFYQISYKTENGETKWLGCTHFEPTYARRVFPCFDEPALKATFLIRIAPPEGLHAISNMPVDSITGPNPENENRLWYNFQKSVVMSTYLVAFVVSDFSFIEQGYFRAISRPETLDSARYPLSISPAILSTMVDLTGVNYSLPKMDNVVLPVLPAVAMENWGMVTYLEKHYLINDDDDQKRLSVATVISHEYAHQWFGNLVSPDWWTYIWLNEGFASFFEYVATDKINPQWNLLTSMVTRMQQEIMQEDGSQHSYPLSLYVETPEEIAISFNLLQYYKGGSIIKMALHFLTEPTFYKGLTIYLKARAFASAEADDLFEALQEAATEDGVLPDDLGVLPDDLTVKEILDTWTLQPGYPLLTVIRDYDAGTATITQKRYVRNGSGYDERWYVPITYTTRSEKNFNRTAPSIWLSPKEGSSITLEGIAADDWLIVNIQEAAYYRVNYDENNWQLLLEALNRPQFDDIHVLNRAQIFDDGTELGVFFRPRLTSQDIFKAFRQESHPAVWITILRRLDAIYNHLVNSKYVAELQIAFAPVVESMSRSRSHDTTILDTDEIEDWVNALSDVSVKSADQRDDQDVTTEKPSTWCARVRAGDWDAVWSRYEEAASVRARRDALAALGCTSDARRLLRAALADSVAPERVREEDRAAALAAPCGSDTRRGVGGGGEKACTEAVAFLAERVGIVQQLLEDPEEYLTLLRRFASRIRSEEQFEKLRFAATEVSVGSRQILGTAVWAEILETARARVDWISGEGSPVISWLRKEAASQQQHDGVLS